ncbi:MAG: DUF5916 domain-containing protein, partial [Leadbetterella sp.]
MRFVFTLFLVIGSGLVLGQSKDKNVRMGQTSEGVQLDGLLNENIWKTAQLLDSFYLNIPFDTSYAKHKTEARICFDSKFIYVSAKVFQKKSSITISSRKRDFEFRTSDEFGVSFDTFNDKVNGFYFGLSPYNIQKEGLLAEGENLNISWDNKWYSAAKVFEDFWQVEMAIPFSTLRYKVSSGENQWRVNFRRVDMANNEVSSWGPAPRNFASLNLAFARTLIWDTPPPKPGVNISLIPFVSMGGNKEFPRDENLQPLAPRNDFTPGVGMDAKVAITPSLNLDITLNPDFSQVEVDQQQT